MGPFNDFLKLKNTEGAFTRLLRVFSEGKRGLHRAYIGRHLRAYLGHGIPKDYLSSYIKLTYGVSERFIKLRDTCKLTHCFYACN